MWMLITPTLSRDVDFIFGLLYTKHIMNSAKKSVKVFFGGDVCGMLGLTTLQTYIPKIIKEEDIDFTVVNGENTANGSGVREEQAALFFEAGVDVITGGNHTLEKFDIRHTFGKDKRILRPHNFPFAHGAGIVQTEKNGVTYIVINLQGRENMRAIDCPFQTADKLFSGTDNNFDFKNAVILVDFHAESTEEKEALAFYLDGRISVFGGTHTHTQTADERILPNGTAYITDAGMIGAYYSVIGASPESAITRLKTQVPQKFDLMDEGPAFFCGLISEIDLKTKKASAVKRVYIKQTL